MQRSFGERSKKHERFFKGACFQATRPGVGCSVFAVFGKRQFVKHLELTERRCVWKPHRVYLFLKKYFYFSPLLTGGYWIWKPHIINKTIHSMPEGSVLVYADSGSVCNRNGIHRFGEYVAAIDASEKKYGTFFFFRRGRSALPLFLLASL